METFNLRGELLGGETMTYRVTQSYCLGAGVDVVVGAIVELPEHLARSGVSMGRLVLVADEAPQESVKIAAPKSASDKHKER